MPAKRTPAAKPIDTAGALYVLGNLTRAQWIELQATIPLSIERLIAGLIDAGIVAPPKAFL